jgi:hypothetical protein
LIKKHKSYVKCDVFVIYPPRLPDYAPEEDVRISEMTCRTPRKRFLEAGGQEAAHGQMSFAFLRAFKVDVPAVGTGSTRVCPDIKTIPGGGLSGRPSPSL